MTIRSALKTGFKAFLSWVPAAVRDVLGVAGLGSIAYGCWLLSPSAGFVVGGFESVAVCALLTAAAGKT